METIEVQNLEDRISRENAFLEASYKRILPVVDHLSGSDRAVVRALLVYRLALDDPDLQRVELLRRISLYSGISIGELRGARKYADIATTRRIAYHAYRRTGLSFPRIARKLGRRNHATVLQGCRRTDREIEYFKDLVGAAFLGRELTGEEIREFRKKYRNGFNYKRHS